MAPRFQYTRADAGCQGCRFGCGEGVLGIDGDNDTDDAASLVIGPTSLGMVRIHVEAEGVDLPLDFDPDEAREIAEELRAAADQAEARGRRAAKGERAEAPGRNGDRRRS